MSTAVCTSLHFPAHTREHNNFQLLSLFKPASNFLANGIEAFGAILRFDQFASSLISCSRPSVSHNHLPGPRYKVYLVNLTLRTGTLTVPTIVSWYNLPVTICRPLHSILSLPLFVLFFFIRTLSTSLAGLST